MSSKTSSPPYAAYAALAGGYVGGLAAIQGVARRLGRARPEPSPLQLAVLALATFKASRTIARDDVTSFLREPFVEGTPGSGDEEHPVQTGGARQAVGELVTCSRCVGTWVAAGLTAADVLAPAFARVLTLSLALGGANDWLQAAFAALTETANRVEAEAAAAEPGRT